MTDTAIALVGSFAALVLITAGTLYWFRKQIEDLADRIENKIASTESAILHGAERDLNAISNATRSHAATVASSVRDGVQRVEKAVKDLSGSE